jgi:protein-S-isoprenylcysteine O-methyltransferase Ste14
MEDQSPQSRALVWPAIGTTLFVLVVPGTVIGLVPFWLSGWRVEEPLFGWLALRWAGAGVFFCGLPVFIDFLLQFVRQGHGTPAPIAPPRNLVVTGSFRYLRNPGYLGVLSLIVGQGLYFGSGGILIYAAGVALAFHLFVVLYEEPELRRRFGAEYEAYRRQVPRWIPRRTPFRV